MVEIPCTKNLTEECDGIINRGSRGKPATKNARCYPCKVAAIELNRVKLLVERLKKHTFKMRLIKHIPVTPPSFCLLCGEKHKISWDE